VSYAFTDLRRQARVPTNDLDLIPGFVFSATADGHIEFVKQQLMEYTGRTLEELKRWTVTDLVHPDDLPRVLDELRRSIETGESQSVEHRVRGADDRAEGGSPVRQARQQNWAFHHPHSIIGSKLSQSIRGNSNCG